MGVIPGTREECLVALKNGYLVSISPGGVREALFSDESYQLMWGNRKGFAQVALEAKVVSTICYQSQFMLSAYVLHYKMQLRSICWKIFQRKWLGSKDFHFLFPSLPSSTLIHKEQGFLELSNFFLTVLKHPSLRFHVYSSIMQASSVSSWLYFRNLHCGLSPYCPMVSFFFLILVGLQLYLTSTYPVIFLWLFNILSLSFSLVILGESRILSLPLLFLMFEKIASTNPRCVYISVWVWIMCALLKQFLHLPHRAFIHIEEHVRIPELQSSWLKLNQNWDLILSSVKSSFSQWFQTRISST